MTGSARRGEPPGARRRPAAMKEEERSAAELKRRLDATKRRLQREIPPRKD